MFGNMQNGDMTREEMGRRTEIREEAARNSAKSSLKTRPKKVEENAARGGFGAAWAADAVAARRWRRWWWRRRGG